MDIIGIVNKDTILKDYTDCNKVIVFEKVSGRVKKCKIYNNSKGSYFRYNNMNIYISDCIKKKNELYQDEKTICKKYLTD